MSANDFLSRVAHSLVVFGMVVSLADMQGYGVKTPTKEDITKVASCEAWMGEGSCQNMKMVTAAFFKGQGSYPGYYPSSISATYEQGVIR